MVLIENGPMLHGQFRTFTKEKAKMTHAPGTTPTLLNNNLSLESMEKRDNNRQKLVKNLEQWLENQKNANVWKQNRNSQRELVGETKITHKEKLDGLQHTQSELWEKRRTNAKAINATNDTIISARADQDMESVTALETNRLPKLAQTQENLKAEYKPVITEIKKIMEKIQLPKPVVMAQMAKRV